MEIHFKGRLSYELFRKAQMLAGPLALSPSLLIGEAGCLGAVLFCFLVLSFVAGKAGILGFLILALVVRKEWLIWRLWNADEAIREPFEGTLSDWGLKWASSSETHEVPWDRLSRQVNSSRILMLFESKDFFHLLAPRFFLNLEEWRVARRLARRKLDW